jgi:predicted ATPase
MMSQLRRIRLNGFRSIKTTELELRPLNVLIGANGAGKSNLISFFKLMNEMVVGRLQQYIASTGRATANLYFGPKMTEQLEAKLELQGENGIDIYQMRLSFAAGDSLFFAEETLTSLEDSRTPPEAVSLGAGHQESLIELAAARGDLTARRLWHFLDRSRVYHFLDTSPAARVRQYSYAGNDRWLWPDAANLAAVLYRLQLHRRDTYDRIVSTVRQIAPFFADFSLRPRPQGSDITLDWRHHGSDLIFGPHQLSDGTLRAICLVSLLLQPTDELPYLIIVDEPELGLHPYALNDVASLFRAAANHSQVLISTQSSTFLDNFEPEDIIVVEHDGEQSSFARQTADSLSPWLEDYSIGEVWEKNVMGGGPH